MEGVKQLKPEEALKADVHRGPAQGIEKVNDLFYPLPDISGRAETVGIDFV